MAYLRTINVPKCHNCYTSTATVSLRNQQNAETGEYCRRCGEAAKKRLQAIEDREFEVRRKALDA